MFFGYTGNGNEREYAWVKEGMIFPFIDYLDKFQGQTKLCLSKPSAFRTAIEEAFLAEHGYLAMEIDGGNVAEQPVYNQSIPGGVQEATDSSQDEECESQIKSVNKSGQYCESCGVSLSYKNAKKIKLDAEQIVCKHCAKVCCDGCQVWVHAECGNVSSNLKDLESTLYFCPDCMTKFRTAKKNSQTRYDNSSLQDIIFKLHHIQNIWIMCRCGSCKAQKLTPTEWERHTGSKSKNWKISVKVEGTMMPLGKWIRT